MDQAKNRKQWQDALCFLDDAYTFIMVGARTSSDWRSDVVSILERQAPDPRGWPGIIPEEYERSFSDSFYPFIRTSPDEMESKLSRITQESAQKLLVILSADEPFHFSSVPGGATNSERLMTDASVLLSRFQPGYVCYTNAEKARDASDYDFRRGVTGMQPLSVYGFDVGLIVVDELEVGVFWAFDAR